MKIGLVIIDTNISSWQIWSCKIPFGVDYDDDNWHNCIVKPEKECANPKPTSWTKSIVETVVTDNFMNNSGIASDFIKNRTYPGEIMNQMFVFMTDQKATGRCCF